MKLKEYKNIKRTEYPKWAGWKLLDFYDSININIFEESKESKIIQLLEENFILIKSLKDKMEQK